MFIKIFWLKFFNTKNANKIEIKVEKLKQYYKKSIKTYIKLNTKKWDGLNYENGFFFLDEKARLLADEIASDLFI